MNVAIYLRKSRADLEAEKSGEFETLNRHKTTLLKLARETNLNVVEIKEEIVSGESILHRPKMLDLLKEVEAKKYDAVLVMDIDRLGRGDMKDQGVILETFKDSGTKIITPRKTYDLMDEFDEEYSEFEAFMARKELKLINRRMQRGRIKSIEEGNYIYTDAPFGYNIVNISKKERTLEPNEQAEIVKLIFDLYINGDMGYTKIARYLNNRHLLAYKSDKWSVSSIRNIVQNRIYTGVLEWQKNITTKQMNENGNSVRIKNDDKNVIVSKGKHPAIITEEIWDKARKIRESHTHTNHTNKLSNPLAGVLKCKICGRVMFSHLGRGIRHITCRGRCGNKGARFEYVEKALLDSLVEYLINYEIKIANNDIKSIKTYSEKDINEKALNELKKELEELGRQKNKLFDLLERGIYGDDTFLERTQIIQSRTETLNKSIDEINARMKTAMKDDKQIAAGIRKVLELYPITDSAKEKNNLLKSVIKEAIYYKRPDQRNDNFDLYVELKVNEN
jgi:site-specific DNA recombinase